MAAAAVPAADRNGNSVHVSAFARLSPFVRPWRWWLSPSISDRFCYSDGVGGSLNVMKGCGRVNLRAAFSPKHNIGPACLPACPKQEVASEKIVGDIKDRLKKKWMQLAIADRPED